MRDTPKPYEIYKHFKGNQYQILNIAKDSEDGHLVVVYQALYGDYQVYVRDLEQFMSSVDKQKYPEVTAQYRFTKVGAESDLSDEIKSEESKQEINRSINSVPNQKSENGSTDISGDANGDSKSVNTSTRKADDVDNTEKSNHSTDADDTEEFHIDPEVEQFLDADSYEDKLNILAGMRNRLTEDMLQIMAVSLDLELNPGSLDDRYKELKNCLLTRDKFEIERF